MKVFGTEVFDISAAKHPAMTDLCDILKETMSERSVESLEIDQKYAGVQETFCNSLSQEQAALFQQYQKQLKEECALTERQQFICGFKTAMQLVLECTK